MSNELTVYKNIQNPLQFINEFGSELARSRLLGCESEAQGRVMALACVTENRSPIWMAQRYHIIEGNISMRADAMLAEFNAMGGKHKILSRTPEKAAIKLTIGDEDYTEEFTWEEAKQERFVYQKDGKTLKYNWATPRSRRQMLWARVVSEAVRTLRPGIVMGNYTPEEAQDFEGNGEVAEVVSAEVTASEPPKLVSATPQQREAARALFQQLDTSEESIKGLLLHNYNVDTLMRLSQEQARELIEALTRKLGEKQPAATGEDLDGPVSAEAVNEIKRLLVAAGEESIQRVRAWLNDTDIKTLGNLTVQAADDLKHALEIERLETFFENALQKEGADEDDAPFDDSSTTSGLDI